MAIEVCGGALGESAARSWSDAMRQAASARRAALSASRDAEQVVLWQGFESPELAPLIRRRNLSLALAYRFLSMARSLRAVCA